MTDVAILVLLSLTIGQVAASERGAEHPAPSGIDEVQVLDPDRFTFRLEDLDQPERQMLEAVLAGMHTSLSQIQSGRVRIAGRCEVGGRVETYDAELVFDVPVDRIRWTNRTDRGVYHYGRNDNESFTCRPTTSDRVHVMVNGRSVPPKIHYARPLDVRCLPLGGWLVVKLSWSLDQLWELLRDGYSINHVQDFQSLREGRIVVVVGSPPTSPPSSNPWWTRVVLDQNVGGQPVSMEYWTRSPDDGAVKLKWRNKTSWQLSNEVWVPERWTTEEPGRLFATLELDWSEVNLPQDPDQFTITNLDLPDGSLVWDSRLGEPVLREKVGAAAIPQRTAIPVGPPPLTSLRKWLVIANLVLLALLAVAAGLYVRRSAGSRLKG